MPWAKVETATGLVTDLFETHPDLDNDELDGSVTVIEVGPEVVIGNTVELPEEQAKTPPHHEVKAPKPKQQQ